MRHLMDLPVRGAVRGALLALAMALTAAPALAQGLDVMRSAGRSIEQALSGQVARALSPVLSVRGLYDAPPRAIALAGDGSDLAVVTGDGGLRVIDLSASVAVLRRDPRGRGFAGVALGPEGRRIAALTAGGAVLYAEGAARLPEAGLSLPGAPASAVAFAGPLLAVGHRDGAVTVLDPASGRTVAQAGATGSPVTALAPTGQGAAVVAGGADGSLRLVGESGAARLDGPAAAVTAIAALGEGRVAVASEDGRVRLLDVAANAVLADWQAHSSGPVALAAGAGAVATGTPTGGAILWDADGDRQATLTDPQDGPVTALALGAPEGRLRALVAGPDTAVAMLDDDAARLVTLYPTRRGWGAVDGQGRFDGDETAFDDLAWSARDLRLPVERYATGYFEPGLVYKHLLGGERFLTAAGRAITDGLPLPPEVSLTVESRAAAPGEPIRLRIEAATPEPLEVADIRLFQNGKRVPLRHLQSDARGSRGDRLTRTRVFAVPAVSGENAFKAVARDTAGIDGAPAEATIRVGADDRPGRLHLTAIGIDRYANPRLNLNYAVADARGIADVVPARGGRIYGGVARTLVLDGAATRAGIREALAGLSDTVPNDAAVLFMAGHAQTVADTWYFLGSELSTPGRPGHIAEVGLSGEELVEALTRVPARRILLVVDACYAGAILGPFERFAQRRKLVELRQQTGVVVIAATRADQEAPEFPRLGHGLMTYVLLEGLKPGRDGALKADRAPRDGRITANELRVFVEETVPGLAALLEESAGRGSGPAASVPVTPVGLALGSNFDLAR